MLGLADIAAAAAAEGLALLGAFHPAPADGAPARCGTLALLGPGPDFWAAFTAAPEFAGRAPDPLNRWSERVISALAARLGAAALFPHVPPWLPFTAWARRTGEAWDSPVGLLVHARLGLFVSYRGALALAPRLPLAAPATRPCDACPRPCLDACPAAALGPAGYDLAACHRFLDTGPGDDCMTRGCAVRRACPVGGQPSAQSAFHMAAFHGRSGECG
jgi:epoxyqueuosine reductase